MAQDFAVGNVVTLRSGGPEMTISSVDGSIVNVYWFDTGGHIQSTSLPDSIIVSEAMIDDAFKKLPDLDTDSDVNAWRDLTEKAKEMRSASEG